MDIFKKLPKFGDLIKLLQWYDNKPLPEGRTLELNVEVSISFVISSVQTAKVK